MVTLAELLKFLSYHTENEWVAYVKLMAYQGCFGDAHAHISQQTYITAQAQATYQEHADIVLQLSPLFSKPFLNEPFQLINHTVALELLQIRFASLKEGFQWLHSVAEIFFLRKDFFSEGTHPAIEKTGINTRKWKKAEDKIYLKEVKVVLYQCAETLNLMGSHAWPENQDINHIVLFSSIETIVKKRIEFINPNFTGTIDCLTGPRGLFNFEPALAAILAKWFSLPNKIHVIQGVLNQYKDDQSEYQWTRNLSGLKREILLALDVTQWPNIQSYYYQDKAVYDKAAELSGRECLDCLGGPWPVAMDLIDYYFQQHFFNRKDITLNPVVAIGKNGRLAGVDDEIKVWYEKFGKAVIDNGRMPIFVACNSIHALPFILNNLINKNYFQDFILRYALRKKSNDFIKRQIKEEQPPPRLTQQNLVIIGPGVQEFDLQHGLDCLAKTLFNIRMNLEDALFDFQAENEETNLTAQMIYAKRIVRYMHRNCLKLSDSALSLGIFYHINDELIKTSGLINFAKNVLISLNRQDVMSLINLLYECTLSNMDIFIASALKKMGNESLIVDRQLLANNDRANAQSLRHLRSILLALLEKTTIVEINKIIHIYKICFNEMKKFIAKLTEQAVGMLGKGDIDYALAFLGSHSRLLGSPYSDIESFVLAKERDHPVLIEIIKLLFLKIINLGETVLPSFGIPGLAVGTIFDDYTPQGLALDRNSPSGCKTPLGKKENGKLIYRLTGTPAEIVKLACTTSYDEYLPQLLRSTRWISGKKSLYLKYKLQLHSESDFKIMAYYFALLKTDLDKSIARLTDFIKRRSARHKNYFFRPVTVIIEDLYGFLNKSDDISSYRKISRLYQYQIINHYQMILFIQNLAIVSYVRFKQVFKFKEQRTEISNLDDEFPVLYQSQQLMLNVFIYLRKLYDIQDFILLIKETKLAIHAHQVHDQLALGEISYYRSPK